MPLLFPITKWGGVNHNDPPDVLPERSHIPSQGGFTQIPGMGTELPEAENMDYHSRGIRQRKGSAIDETISLADTWAQVGNDLNIATVGVPALAALSKTRVAFIDTTNDDLRTYDFDGTDWSQTGNDLNITAASSSVFLAGLDSDDIAYIDDVNDDLRTYRFDGTDWAQVGNDLNLSAGFNSASVLGALNSTNVILWNGFSATLQAYRFDGTDWVALGNSLFMPIVGTPALAVLTSSRIVLIDNTHATITAYDFDGTDWAQVGNSATFSSSFGAPALTGLNDTDAVYIDSSGEKLSIFRFDNADWKEILTPLSIGGVGEPALTAISSSQVAFIDGTNDDLRTYEFSSAGQFIKGVEWRAPSSGKRIQVEVTSTTIFTDQSGTMTQINDSSGALFFFDSAVAKVTLVKADGHLFICTDGANNEIQVYREGTDLDAAMSNGNTYENAYGSGTNTITGTWPKGAYLGVAVNSRLAFSDGNVLIEFTPMSHAASSGIWDLGGSTAGAFHARGNITMMTNFVPHLTNSIQETVFIGTELGFEFATGFLSFDNLVAVEGSLPPLNHKAFFKSRGWIAYLTEDKNIHAINRHAVINLGRRFKTPEDDEDIGPLDGMSISDSERNSFGFYDGNKERGYLSITTASTKLNNTWLVLDFKKGEPISGEPLESFERRVRCMVWKIKNSDANKWFVDVYQRRGAVIGVLQSGKLYTLETGNNDLDSIAIEAFVKPPWITGGDQVLSRNKTFGRLDIRSVPIDGTNTLTVDIFQDWSTTGSKTASKNQAATIGDIVKMSVLVNLSAEALQAKLSNNNLNETFILSSVKQEYDIGAEVRA